VLRPSARAPGPARYRRVVISDPPGRSDSATLGPPVVVANEVLAFLLEIIAIAALTFWGWRAGGVLLALALPVAAIVLWALFAAPRARFPVPLAAQLAVKALVFGAATVGLFATGHAVLAVTFAVVVVANTAAATVWRSRRATSRPRDAAAGADGGP
jgi:uncharacterized protein DUF2568